MTTQRLAILWVLLGLIVGAIIGNLFPGALALIVLFVVVAVVTFFDPGPDRQAVAPPVSQNRLAGLGREFERGRRHQRPFAVLRIVSSSPPNGRRGRRRGISATPWYAGLWRYLRVLDQVWEDDGAILVVLPETDRATAQTVVERLRKAIPEIGREHAISLAVFPDDGVTLGALLGALEGRPVGPAPIPAISGLDSAGAAGAVPADSAAAPEAALDTTAATFPIDFGPLPAPVGSGAGGSAAVPVQSRLSS